MPNARPSVGIAMRRVAVTGPARPSRAGTTPGWWGCGGGTSSWTAPVDVCRLAPDDDPVAVTAAQIRALVARLAADGRCGMPGQPVPMAILDCGYPAPGLADALAGVGVQLLVRLGDEGRRVFYADSPARQPGQVGRPARHGARFKLADPATWPAPDQVHGPCGGGFGPLRPGGGACLVRVAPAAADPRALHRPPAARGRGGHGDPGERRAAARRSRAAQDAVVVVERPAGAVGGPGRVLAGLPAPLRRRAHLPVRQGHLGLDRGQGPHPRAGRPLDLAGPCRLHPASPRRSAGPRPSPSVGAAARSGPAAEPALGPPWVSAHPRSGPKPCRPGPGRPKGHCSGPARRYPVAKQTDKADNPTN